jgi:hydroxymethylpyrimidine/phosphomethylpyrimidine kinase
MPQSPPLVLTIAGFDPSSGAGVTADIKTIAAHGCYGIAAITALTVQSSLGVRQVSPVDPKLLRETLNNLAEDMKVSAVRVGMLGSLEVAKAVADFFEQKQLPNVVLDTVLKSSSGAKLLDDAGRNFLTLKLLTLADVITPNAEEAGILTGMEVSYLDDMRAAAEKLHEMGARDVVITGGHLDKATDLFSPASGEVQIFKSDRQESDCTHGTGCAFATAVACQLANGRALAEAVLLSKAYVTAAIANAYRVGRGTGPVNHMYRMRNHPGGLAKKLASGRA